MIDAPVPESGDAPQVPPATVEQRALPPPSGRERRHFKAIILLFTASFLVLFGVARAYRYERVAGLPPWAGSEPMTPSDIAKQVRDLRSKIRGDERSLASLRPGSIYVVVDTAQNRLYVKRGDKVLLEAVCSTGSGRLLVDPDTGRQWIFDTPRGRFTVLRKREDPVWTKPDWAFVEEGKPAPQKWSERRDYETLGDYALDFGDGYMIHGTLYQRYLGQSITHGCVRLGDDDLARVFRLTPVGAPILIF